MLAESVLVLRKELNVLSKSLGVNGALNFKEKETFAIVKFIKSAINSFLFSKTGLIG
jgi:hypothetical protein